MATDIRVPALGESVTEATVGRWLKKPGDAVAADEPLVEIETEKVALEVPAPAAGVLSEIKADKGTTVGIGALLGVLDEKAGAQPRPKSQAASARPPESDARPQRPQAQAKTAEPAVAMPPSPAARKVMAEKKLQPEGVKGSGKRGQILKQDALAASPAEENAAPQPPPRLEIVPAPARDLALHASPEDAEREERVPMTRLRQTIARRLKDAQNTAAMLTTFNDVDMTAITKLRVDYKELFEKRYGIKLGFMGFFVKACVQALREIPAVNAEIDGGEIVYKNYYHLGVAVSTERGLVVPVVRAADRKSLAEIETEIADYGRRAREGKLAIEEMQGGTFTITNGGVFGSLMSTPILNAPQSGILGMHRIEERAVVRDGAVVARPMMYLALTYDHRLVDGREAVTFLVRVKESLEDPNRFVLEL